MELDTATNPDERVTRGVTVAPITLSASISVQPCRRRDALMSAFKGGIAVLLPRSTRGFLSGDVVVQDRGRDRWTSVDLL